MESRDRQKYSTRLKSYKNELNNLEKDLVSVSSVSFPPQAVT